MNSLRPTLLLLVIVSLLIAACGSATPTSATGSPTPAPTPAGGPVTTEAQAVARILQIEPRLMGMTPRDPNAIGQASWYEVAPASGVGAFVASVRVGWGDCEAGCINEHTWVYAVGPNGEVTIQSEGGEPVPAGVWPSPAAGGGGGGVGGPGTGLFITASAGPTCPVEQIPPDPACAPRPVTTALVVVTDATGNGVAKVQVDETGTAFIELPPGDYLVEASSVDGLMGTPASVNVTVVDGTRTPVDLLYDTGIR